MQLISCHSFLCVYSWYWYKDGEHASISRTCSARHDGVATATFSIDRATVNDAGDYVLYGRNRHGQVHSATFSLTMAGQPVTLSFHF